MTQRAKNALIAYFDYQQTKAGNGYDSKSIVAKMMGGDIGSGNQVSGSVKGVEMTDLGFLQIMNKVEIALNDLKPRYPRVWEYLHLRYGEAMNKSEIADSMGCCIRTCTNMHESGIEFVGSYV